MLCAGCSRTSCALEITRDESSFMIMSPEELCLQGSVSGYSYIFFLCSSSNPWDFCFIHEQKQMIFIVHAAMSGTGNIYSARCFLLYFIEHPWRNVGTAMDLLLLSPERGMVLQTLTVLLKETPASPVVLGTHFLARGSDNSLFLMPTQICPFPLFLQSKDKSEGNQRRLCPLQAGRHLGTVLGAKASTWPLRVWDVKFNIRKKILMGSCAWVLLQN